VKTDKRYWILIPLLASLVFVLLYVIAAGLYPGGNYEDRTAKGFNWEHNYWCNLLHDKAINGEVNTARPLALAAMGVLAFGLLSFWMICARLMYRQQLVRWIMYLSGVISIAALFYLSSELHDTVINISGGFGLIAMAGVYAGLYQKRWRLLFLFGIINIFLIAANNYIYYSGNGFFYLPIVQKITFLSCLAWIDLVSWKLYKEQKLVN
jgi:hypothetical protein